MLANAAPAKNKNAWGIDPMIWETSAPVSLGSDIVASVELSVFLRICAVLSVRPLTEMLSSSIAQVHDPTTSRWFCGFSRSPASTNRTLSNRTAPCSASENR